MTQAATIEEPSAIPGLLTLGQAAERIGPVMFGRRPTLRTVRNWIKRGRGGVKLKAKWTNGRWLTTEKLVDRFLEDVRRQESSVPGGGQ